VAGHPLIFIYLFKNYLFILIWDVGYFGKKKKSQMVELQQFGSLWGGGGGEVKCHFLKIGTKSANVWIIHGGKMYFSLKVIIRMK
jgi:hypothetical protein